MCARQESAGADPCRAEELKTLATKVEVSAADSPPNRDLGAIGVCVSADSGLAHNYAQAETTPFVTAPAAAAALTARFFSCDMSFLLERISRAA